LNPKLLAIAILGISLSVDAAETCFVCSGNLHLADSPVGRGGDYEDQETFCFLETNKKVTHLSARGQVVDFVLVRRDPVSFTSPGYLYWEATKSYSNHRYNEQLKTYIEFVELKRHLQVVDKNSEGTPRLAFNGKCQETKRLK
jgi:hypothetical protein